MGFAEILIECCADVLLGAFTEYAAPLERLVVL
jgi:hypothetical protein